MENLRIPGPTPCPDEVLQAMTKQMINHRGPEFARILNRVTESLKILFQTRNDIFLLTGSGTGGLEAAVVNTLSPGDTVLSVSIGVFGDRFTSIAEQYGAEVIPLKFEWGKAADPDEVRRALEKDPKIKAVLVTHNETSTGVTNDLASLSSMIKEFDKLLIVDAISSLGSINLPVDKWGCDIAVTGSQKGWMAPPGLAMVSVSETAWQAHANARMPRFYWDFSRARSYLERGQTPWTPAVSTVFAMNTSLGMMLDEGLPNIIARHARIGQLARDGVKSLGLTLFADENFASNTVTAINAPEGVNANDLRKILLAENEIVLGGGQQRLDGMIFRIGHLGMVAEEDIRVVISALKGALAKVR
ncbi:MAG: alanine--glyoxylate aminotransferase family protein [Dehalococcoidales bacterium]|nr:alanine--glyoxylate aminotransferase family protein [Dehalococcoidales bacterium]